jgi:hypothetical protein
MWLLRELRMLVLVSHANQNNTLGKALRRSATPGALYLTVDSIKRVTICESVDDVRRHTIYIIITTTCVIMCSAIDLRVLARVAAHTIDSSAKNSAWSEHKTRDNIFMVWLIHNIATGEVFFRKKRRNRGV